MEPTPCLSRDIQICLQISVKITHNVPTEIQYWINTLCHDIVAKTISRVVDKKNGLDKEWVPLWTPYHDGVDGVNPIFFQSNSNISRDSTKDSLGLTWNNGRALLDHATFNKFEFDGTPQAKLQNIHIRIIFNGPPEDHNSFRRHIQEALQAFHPKS